jgi:predicted SPOUT superfamily RNA methylase MTH1
MFHSEDASENLCSPYDSTKVPGQKNDLAARIARAAAVFCVDEVVVFDDDPTTIPPQLIKRKGKKPQTKAEALAGVEPYNEPFDNPDQFLYHLLSYLECPGHLRKHLFPEHDNLRSAGQLPTLDMPHHMRAHEWCQYREGAALGPVSARNHVKSKKARSNGSEAAAEQATLVDCGLSHPVTVPYAIPPGTRVTLRFADSEPPPSWPHLSEDEIAELKVEPTTSDEPREKAGYYWGFSVRKADSLSAVYTESPFAPDGYDFSLGTSERGVPLSSIFPDSPKNSTKRTSSSDQTDKLPPKFQHLLLVFGGVAGLEPAVASDPVLKEKGLTKETAHNAFDLWVNLVPGQGSRTIRTEEAVWLGLMGLRDYVTSMS